MNTSASRNRLLDRFRDHLPEILYTEVPVPAFLETPISELLFKANARPKKPAKNTAAKNPTSACLEGRITAGKEAKYAINGKDLALTTGTWIVGNIEIGSLARAKGKNQGSLFNVTQLTILRPKT